MNLLIRRLIISVLKTLPLLFGTYFIIGLYRLGEMNFGEKFSTIVFYSLLNGLFFMTMFNGKIDRHRSVLFIIIAISFPIEFVLGLYEQRGHFMYLTFSDMINGIVPFCHIVIPQTFIPTIFSKEVVFPGLISKFTYSAGFMIITWIAVSLLIGRGWCSWACFFGGWEDGCSRICKKSRVKLNRKIIYSAFAVLILVVLTTIEFATPTYCLFLCPFKACSEFVEVSTPLVVFQTILFSLLFIILVIILPILTKKRTQCIALCPFGAFQSMVDKVSPIGIRVDKEECIECQKCINICPMMSISMETLEKGSVGFTCTKCGKCIDSCPKKCINFYIKGTPKSKVGDLIVKNLFLYLSYVIMAGMGSFFVISAIKRILLFIQTGSILH